MAKPIIKKITPIDTNLTNRFSFSYTGVIRSVLTQVFDADTLSVVAQSLVNTLSSNNLLFPTSSSFINGKRYAIQIIVYDDINGGGNPSTPSDKLFFWALTTPTFEFVGLTDTDDPATGRDNIIRASSYNAIINYQQPEGELLSSYIFYWYDSGKVLLSQTDAQYDVTSVSYNYKGLDSDKIYYIRCTGLTRNGISLDTGLVIIFPTYSRTGNYAQIYATASEGTGIVTYKTNIIDVRATRDDYNYVDDVYIDLTNDAVEYNEDFSIDKDFSIVIRFKEGKDKLLTFVGNRYTADVYAVIDYNGYTRYKVVVPNAISNYVLYTEPLLVSDTDIVILYVSKQNNLYRIKAYIQQ